MEKTDVVRVLEEMAILLELADASPFEVMAFHNGARNLEEWEGDLRAAAVDKTLAEIPGIGKGLSAVISELVLDGRSAEHDRLRGLFPAGLLELLRVPGLGPKKVKALHRELGIDSLDGLERAAREQRIRGLKGFGPRSEERIITGVERARQYGTRSPGR
jgi:DNA polymerase (family 10)